MNKIKVAITGLEQAGKTAFTQRLLTGKFIDTIPTFGIDVEFTEYKGMALQIWDLGGHEAFRKNLWKNYIAQSSSLIYIFDASNLSNLQANVEWFWTVIDWLEHKEYPILFLANKWDDVPNNDKDERIQTIIEEFKLNKLAKTSTERSFQFFFVSVKTGLHIDTAMTWLIDHQPIDEKFKSFESIHCFDCFVQGKGFFAHISNIKQKRRDFKEIIHTYKDKWVSSLVKEFQHLEEITFENANVQYLSLGDLAVLTITDEGLPDKPFMKIAQDLQQYTPLKSPEDAFDFFSMLKKALINLFLDEINTTLTCQIHLN